MDRGGNRDGSGFSRNDLAGENIDMIKILQEMMETQQKQMVLLRQRLLAARKEQRPGSIFYFRWLRPIEFLGIENPLDAEQWLVDTIDILKAAQILEENQVEIARFN